MRRLLFWVGITCLVGLVAFRAGAEEKKMAAVPGTGFVPEWSKRMVWYQIFPERFRNGDPRNDPTLQDIKGSWPHDQSPPWQIHSWTSDWYELQPYEKANGKDLWFNLQRRRYGGDLQGVVDKLDYLKALGITGIYLNPVFAAPSSHKYDAYTYHHIDPTFGPDPAGDRKIMATEKPDDPSTWHWTAADKLALRLIKEAHQRGMRVIFDGVFNHMGMTNPFLQDVIRRQKESPYKDWFSVKSWRDPAKGTKFEYEGWFGIKELPNWRQDANGIVTGPRRYIFDITRRWMDPSGKGHIEDGIDGWRLDVAFCVKHPFWKDWSRNVRSINPQAYLTAEVIDTVEANKPYLQGDEFSAVMNYNFAFACTEFFFPTKDGISPTVFDGKLKTLREAYPAEVAYGMQNLMGSHDTARMASNIVNADLIGFRDWSAYCDQARGRNPKYDTRAPDAAQRQRQKLAVVFQMTYVGAPMIYYGDEVGMWGATDPCCRKPMVWDDLKYQDEAYLPDGKKRPKPDPVRVDRELLEHYRKCIAIRNAQPALQTGAFKTLLADDGKGVYAFERTSPGNTVVVALNNGDSARRFTLPVGGGTWKDVLSAGTTVRADAAGSLPLDLGARAAAILVRQE